MMIDCDVYFESVFWGLYRNWNLDPCLKVGGIVLHCLFKPPELLTIQNKDFRIGVHINEKVFVGYEEIREHIDKFTEDEILSMNQLEDMIGYRFTVDTKITMREQTGTEGIWFRKNSVRIDEL